MIVFKDEMKKMEQLSGLSTSDLILEVGHRCYLEIKKLINKENKILVIYGKGNNGEDGKVIFNNLINDEYNIKLISINDLDTIDLNCFDVLIDAIFGFSFHLPLSNEYKDKFKKINKANKTVISIDLNSGIEADTGNFDTDAIRSTYTLILGHKKICHALHKNSDLYEKEIVIDLPLANIKTQIFELNEDNYKTYLPLKSIDAHKNSTGRLLLYGGSLCLAGSITLASKAALSSGCSYLHILSDERCYEIIGKNVLSAVYHFYPLNKVSDYIDKVDALGIGMGADNFIGFEEELLKIITHTDKPILLDAYALRIISKHLDKIKDKSNIVLTPHIGEFSSLINKPVKDIKDNQLTYAKEFVDKYNVTLVLKSPNTIVINKDNIYINETGNNKLAKAGSGDTLSGIISALLSRNLDPFIAASLGTYLHGKCADLSKCHEMAFTVEDIPEILKNVI